MPARETKAPIALSRLAEQIDRAFDDRRRARPDQQKHRLARQPLGGMIGQQRPPLYRATAACITRNVRSLHCPRICAMTRWWHRLLFRFARGRESRSAVHSVASRSGRVQRECRPSDARAIRSNPDRHNPVARNAWPSGREFLRPVSTFSIGPRNTLADSMRTALQVICPVQLDRKATSGSGGFAVTPASEVRSANSNCRLSSVAAPATIHCDLAAPSPRG